MMRLPIIPGCSRPLNAWCAVARRRQDIGGARPSHHQKPWRKHSSASAQPCDTPRSYNERQRLANANAAAAQTAFADPLAELRSGARLTHAAHFAWSLVLREGDTAVDATAGNGNDTAMLARQVGPGGRVWAFDVQAGAIAATRELVQARQAEEPQALCDDVRYVHDCHSKLQEYCGSNVARVVAFNLGHWPGSDKAVKTRPASTRAALEAALEVVAEGGLVSVLCYTGHEGGREEYEAVRALVAALPPAYWVATEQRLLNRPTAPLLLLLWRR